MTVFLEVAKKFLEDEVTSIRNKSVKADGSLMNKATTFMGFGRDLELSKAKQDALDEACTEIKKVEDQLSDAATLELFIRILNSAKEQTKKKSIEKDYINEGKTEPRIEKAISVVKAIFLKLKDFNIIDVKDVKNADKFYHQYHYQFCLHSATYLLQRIVESRKVSTIEYVTHHPKFSSLSELAMRKEKLIKDQLSECKKDLGGLDSNSDDYPEHYKNRVVENIEKLRRKNVKLCKEYGINYKIPLSLDFIGFLNLHAPTLTPDFGAIDVRMKKALDKINALPLPERRSSLTV